MDTDFTCGKRSINTRIKATSAIEKQPISKDDRKMTSLIATSEDGDVMFYVGFDDGTISKVCQMGHYQYFPLLFNLYHSLGKFNRRHISDIFLIFSQKTGFDFACILSPLEITCM